MNSKLKLAVIIILSLSLSTLFYILFSKNISTKGMRNYSEGNFIIYYNELSDETLSDLKNMLTTTEAYCEPFFKDVVDRKTTIVVFDDTETFQRKSFGLLISWILPNYGVGAFSNDSVYMTSPENPNETTTYSNLIEVAGHEYIHSLTTAINNNPDIWLDEGLALYFAKQKDDIIYEIPSFDEMQKQSISKFVEAEGYMFSYYYIEYLLKSFGNEAVLGLISSNDYPKFTNLTKYEIYENWVLWLKIEYGL